MSCAGDYRHGAGEDFNRGIEEFNVGNWFDCHEIMEELWVGAPDGLRDLYQGILQVAVALHHWQKGNFKGAMLLFASGTKLLRHLERCCLGVDVAGFNAAAERMAGALESLGAARMHDLDRQLIPRIRRVDE